MRDPVRSTGKGREGTPLWGGGGKSNAGRPAERRKVARGWGWAGVLAPGRKRILGMTVVMSGGTTWNHHSSRTDCQEMESRTSVLARAKTGF